ncbi:IclR family transcriptional regulator [Hoeflea poritis]|uniref:IclR family transcriptional regulator n=1 Tax=Hoeflea poritis TaxID=2993659 RepID=A0ABT4VQ63_9HYPH|nr:IclR family transcriptional regulator [Hoeflea poritis]MDA4846158.1 IclR family transcriptional regulator [Hoeflea poritis]
MSDSRDYRIAAVDRALSVLEVLSEKGELGVTEMAAELGMTKSLVFRILHTLEARGYVAKNDANALYALGYRAWHLGDEAAKKRGLLLVAEPQMDALRDRFNENVNLIVRDGLNALVVTTRESRHSMRLYAAPGRHGPLHAGGGSMVLLAYAPPEVQDETLSGRLTHFASRTITDPEELRKKLMRIASDGFHVTRNDLDEGAFSVAAPINGPGGDVVAAISVAGPVARLDKDLQSRILKDVLASAAAISHGLGAPSDQPVVAAQ